MKLLQQDDIEKRFLSSFNYSRMHQAFLLHGIKGIGKAGFALRVARFLLSQQISDTDLFEHKEYNTLDIMQDSKTYRMIEQNTHPDFLLLSKEQEGKINVEQIRKIVSFLSLKSAISKYKVVIIDDIDNLNVSSYNALLKILEEPPAFSIFFLISNAKDCLPKTITSRCMKYYFFPLSDDSLVQILPYILQDYSEHEDYSPLISLAQNSAGMLRRIISNNGLELYAKIAVHFSNPDPQKIKQLCSEAGESNDKWLLFHELLFFFIRRLINYKIMGLNIKLILNEEKDLLSRLDNRYNFYHLVRKYNQIKSDLNYNLILATNKENLLMRYFL